MTEPLFLESEDQPMSPPVPPEVDLLQRYLCDRDTPCPRCEYNLRGLSSRKCPECGDKLQLQVGLADPKLGAYITLLVSLCIGFGGSSLMGMIALTQAGRRWWTQEPSAMLLAIQWLWTGIALPAVLAQRRKFRRINMSKQWWAAGCALAAVAIVSLLIIVLFDG